MSSDAEIELREMSEHYSAALDEIYRLRAILAYEARVQEVTAEFATYPKSRRPITEASVERMRTAARGFADELMAELGMTKVKWALRSVDASETLTRHQWENRREDPR